MRAVKYSCVTLARSVAQQMECKPGDNDLQLVRAAKVTGESTAAFGLIQVSTLPSPLTEVTLN